MCITPLTLKNPKKNQSFPIPCGKCPECIKKRTSQWSFRLIKEAEASSSAFFLTLTYNTETCPLSTRGYPTLDPKHVTNFLKRLRKLHIQKLKYYYVGEYGSKTQRPHYHMLIFNAEVQHIESTWNYGAVHYGTVEGASIGYTLKYMCKGLTDLQKWKKRYPQFSRMSKGLGISYLTADIMYYHTDRNYLLERVCMKHHDKKISMPRFYKDRIYDPSHKYYIQQQAEQRAFNEYRKRYNSIADGTLNLHSEIEYHKDQIIKMKESREKNRFI